MKPTNADARLWEARQARDFPAWVRTLADKRTAPHTPTSARLAMLVHEAINVRAGNIYGHPDARPAHDQRNAISLLQLVRRNQERERARGYWTPNLDGTEPAKTLAEYMVWCTCARRGKYYRRWVRQIRAAELRETRDVGRVLDIVHGRIK